MRNCRAWKTSPLLLALVLFTTPAFGEDVGTRSKASKSLRLNAKAPSGQTKGYKATVDPITGEFTVPPPAAAIPGIFGAPPPARSLATSHEGLVPVPGTTRGGGWVVDLKGRFRSAVVATVSPDGPLTTRCVTTSTRSDPGGKAVTAPTCPDEASDAR